MISRKIIRSTQRTINRYPQLLLSQRWVNAEANIQSLGLQMPDPAVPKGNFVNYVEVNGMAYLSGHLPQPKDGPLVIGRVGEDLSVEQGYEAAKFVGLNMLATLKHNLGDLDRVKRVVKLFGLVSFIKLNIVSAFAITQSLSLTKLSLCVVYSHCHFLSAQVNCPDGFTQQPAVVNGCSDLMVKVFGEQGNHTRSAVGTNSLPLGVAVEIEGVFELHPEKKSDA